MCDTSPTQLFGGCTDWVNGLPNCGGEWTNDGHEVCNAGFGRRRKCRRTQCRGDPSTCCITGESGSPHFRCNTRWTSDRMLSDDCRTHWQNHCRGNINALPECQTWANEAPRAAESVMREFCGGGERFGYPAGSLAPANARGTFCWRWCQANPRQCQSVMKRYCNNVNKIGESICQEWVGRDPERTGFGGAGEVDGAMRAFCDRRPNNPLCSCINIPAGMFRGHNPVCVDADCASRGYITSNLLASRGDGCPDVVDCNVIFDLQTTGDINFTDNVIEQECTMTTNEPPAPVFEASPGLPVTMPEPPRAETTLLERWGDLPTWQQALVVLGFLVIISIAIALIAYGALAEGSYGGFSLFSSKPKRSTYRYGL